MIPIKSLLACALFYIGSASAMSLLQAYEAALQNDPVYRAAVHENEAGKQYAVLGRANLLPTVSISYSASRNQADITAPNASGGQTANHVEYASSAATIALRQPILNLDGLARYRQGIAQTHYSDAQFAGRQQDLMLRLVGTYTDAHYAQDQLSLALAQRDAFAEQQRVNARRFQKGEGTRTDVLETQAKLELAEAQVIEARDSLTNARNALAAIVGVEVTQLDALSDGFRVKPMQPATLGEWKQLAVEKNAEIAAQRHALETARQEIDKNRAGHMPRLDLVANYGRNKSESVSTFNQDSTVRNIGVQLTIPLYAGGSVQAATSQAVANHAKAKAELDSISGKVWVELRKQYSLALSSAARIDALMRSVDAARLLIDATRLSVQGGVRVNLDLLNAEQQLHTARRDLAQARYGYLLSYLRLRFSAGTLGMNDLRDVAGYFVAPR
jgi:protease secretion system outer membrane protein